MSDIFQGAAPDKEAPPVFACALFTTNNAEYFGNITSSAPESAIFDLGSVTKILSTTSIIMKLVEAKIVELDNPVSYYLPHPLFEQFSVKDLLMHRSGLWEWWPLYATLENSETVVEYIANKELRYPPKSGWHYSDLGFILLGEIIKRVTQSTLPEIFADLVATPLGLIDTKYSTPTSLARAVPSSHGDSSEFSMLESNSPYPVDISPSSFKHWRTGILQGQVNDGNAFHLFGGESGHAGLFASLSDLVLFGQELLDGNYFANINEFVTGGVDPIQALGFRRFGSDFSTFGHTGFPGIAVVLSQKNGKGFAFGTNRLLVQGTPTTTMSFVEPLLETLK